MATLDCGLRRSGTKPLESIRRTAKAPVTARRPPPKIRRLMEVLTLLPRRGWSRLSQGESRQRDCGCGLNGAGIFDRYGETVARDGKRRQHVRPHVPVCGGG